MLKLKTVAFLLTLAAPAAAADSTNCLKVEQVEQFNACKDLAEQGDAEAQRAVGRVRHRGLPGVRKDYTEAIR